MNDAPLSTPLRPPTHEGVGPVGRVIEVGCVLGAYGLILGHGVRIYGTHELQSWTTLLLVLAAWPAADFVSGLVHWTLDTWGKIEWPIVGPRLLKAFRVHHINPQSFIHCDFFNTNGDTAGLAVAFLLGVWFLPLPHPIAGRAAVFLVAFSFWGLPTNQFHQWAHIPRPPAWVAVLQQLRLILPSEHHQRHHMSPFVCNYCITTGWCNPLLEAIGFWRRLEWIVHRLTGFVPRTDDVDYQAKMQTSQAAGHDL